MKNLFFFVLFIILFLSKAAQLNQDIVVIAIDCGADIGFATQSGYDFVADDYFSGQSNIADYTYSEIILFNKLKYTIEPTSFLTERHGEYFKYMIPLSQNGRYTLILQFIELYFSSIQERVFNIQLGDQIVRKDFSILAKVPDRFYAHEEYIEFSFQDEQIFWNDQVCRNAYMPQTKQLIIEFTKGSADLPKIDGIILAKGAIESYFLFSISLENLQQERDDLINRWEEIEKDFDELPHDILKIQQDDIRDQLKRQEKEVLKNQQYLKQEDSGILNLIFSWQGILVWLILGMFVIGLFCLDTDSSHEKYRKKRKVLK